jgi:hypothetical protein
MAAGERPVEESTRIDIKQLLEEFQTGSDQGTLLTVSSLFKGIEFWTEKPTETPGPAPIMPPFRVVTNQRSI